MPPKSTKKTPWVECHSCQCEITSNDIKFHSEHDCGRDNEDYKVAFIRGYTLYGFIEYIDEFAEINKYKPKNIVCISPSAGNTCQLIIGEPVCLRKSNGTGPPIARRFWPSKSSSLSSILLSPDGLEKTWSCNDDRRVTVSPIKSNIYEASYIHITAVNANNLSDEIYPLLKQHYTGIILNVKNKLNLNYFGKEYNFKINKISSDENCIMQSESVIWYSISENTKWKLEDKNTKDCETDKVCKTLGGVDTILKKIKELIDYALFKNIPNISHIRGVLLFGHSGTGKSAICKYLINTLNCYSITINGAEIFSKYFGETENTLKVIFKKALNNAPSVIYIDEIDAMCPVKLNGRTDQEKRVVSTFVSLLDNLHEMHSKVFILTNTNHPDQINPSLRRYGRLDHEIEIPVPNKKSRFEILSALLDGVNHSVTKDELVSIADAAHGFVGADLLNLCTQASMHAITSTDSIQMHTKDLNWALTMVKPSAMREVLIEVPNVRWDDIGGQDDLKLKLRQAIEWPLKHGASFTRLGIKPPNGVLMYGPPGCSKTMIAKALANESGLNFLSIKGPELFSKWVGESEKAVRELFRKARQVSPSIIFFDEIDALSGERVHGSGGTNVNDRVLAQLLTELDGIIPLNNVVVVAATNRPDKMDPSLLRPGRIDRLVYVPLPDKETRIEILKIALRKMCVSDDVIMADLVDKMEGLSGAEVKAVCQEAALKALEEDILCNQIEFKHFKTALANITPRTPKYLLDIYDNFLNRNKT